MMTLAGKNLRLFQPVPGKSKRMSPQAPLYRKRKLTAVCSHQTRIGNLDAHLI